MAIMSEVSFRLGAILAKLDIIHRARQREARHHLVFSKVSARTDVVPAAKWNERSSKIFQRKCRLSSLDFILKRVWLVLVQIVLSRGDAADNIRVGQEPVSPELV